MNQEIILVNESDEAIGYGEKLKVHRERQLHRAFSIFLFDRTTQKMLLQKRAYGKYHSGGLWTNACCSHPRKNETMETCLNSRLKEELGIDTCFCIVDPSQCDTWMHGSDVIYSCGKFSYFASFGEVGENEIDHVFVYSPCKESLQDLKYAFDTEEIAELKWISLEELDHWLKEKPEEFTAWFAPAYELAYHVLQKIRK